MAFSWTNANNKVARRVILTFLLASMLPLLIFAAVAYVQVTHELQREKAVEIRDTAKRLGMQTFSQLQWVRDGLALLAELSAPVDAIEQRLAELNLDDRIQALYWVDIDSLAAEAQRHQLAPAVLQALSDRSLVNVGRMRSGKHDSALYMSALSQGRPGKMLVARLREDFLWLRAGVAGSPERICVLDQQGLPVMCNQAIETAWLQQLNAPGAWSRRAMPVDTESGTILSASWGLFLKPHYGIDYWYFLVGVPESEVLAPIRLFRQAFPLVAVLLLCLSLWLSIRLVRSNLRPLDAILQAARRLGDGDFKARANVRSDDEFAQVGEVLDQAAIKLGRNFQFMQAMSELDSRLRGARRVEQALVDVREVISRVAGGDCVMVLNDMEHDGLYFQLPGEQELKQLHGCGSERAPNLPAQLHSGTVAGLGKEQYFLLCLGLQASDRIELIPVTVGGRETLAVMVLVNARVQEQERVLLAQMADILGMVIQNLRLNRRLTFQAKHDPLTRLFNRTGLAEQFQKLSAQMHLYERGIAVMIFDLDHFKMVNDTQGHAAGDRLLVDIAGRMTVAFSDMKHIVCSRFSGDEFVLLIGCDSGDDHRRKVDAVAERLAQVFMAPFYVAGRPVKVNASKGVAICGDARCELNDMLQHADMAMYRAKESRSGEMCIYDAELTRSLEQRMDIEHALKGAIAANELEVFYQPIVDVHSGRLYAAESLLRWDRPGIGLVSPALFVPIAEELGIIHEFGVWVFETVCRDLARWQVQPEDMYISVNLSPLQMEDTALPERFAQILEQTGVSPECVVLEITETAVMKDSEAGNTVLRRLRELGLRLLVDDFGTGHASFMYLRDLPIDGVKIDRMFVTELPDNPKDRAIVSGMATLARDMRLRVVVEGVETRDQAAFLLAQGLQVMQGYMFSKPLPGELFEPYVKSADADFLLPTDKRQSASATSL